MQRLIRNLTAVAVVIWAVASLTRTAEFNHAPEPPQVLAAEHRPDPDRAWAQWRGLLVEAGAPPVIGYWDDMPLQQRARNFSDAQLFPAQFGMSPFILVPDGTGPWIIVDSKVRTDLPAGYVVVDTSESGARLMRKAAP